MTEKEIEVLKQALLTQLKHSLEGNIGSRLTVELATGIFSRFEVVINDKTSITEGK